MRIYIDTEFYEDGRTIDLISLGAVADDGREFYAESRDFDWSRVPDDHWLQENVRPHLRYDPGTGNSRAEIRDAFLAFVNAPGEEPYRTAPEFWGYYADYDWVVLCQLYGTMVDLPSGWPMYCLDVKQLAIALGDPELPKYAGLADEPNVEHHALHDAREIRFRHDWLNDLIFRATPAASDA